MSGRDARRARQRKQEARERRRVEAQKALAALMGAFIRHSIEAERRLMTLLGEFLPPAKDSPWAKYGGQYVEWDAPLTGHWKVRPTPANPDHHTWTRLPARWSAVDPARGPDQSRQLTVNMLARADAFRAASDTRPYFEIISQQDLDQMRDDAERNTNDAIRRRLFG